MKILKQIKSNQKGFDPVGVIIVIILLVVCVWLVVFVVNRENTADVMVSPIKDDKVVIRVTDSHGCFVNLGYIWCETKQKCLKLTDEACVVEADSTTNDEVVVEDVEDNAVNNVFSCNLDTDCVPLPSDCHPMNCINKDFSDGFVRPEMCTEIFMVEAAYKKEDCGCSNNKCVNNNLERDIDDFNNDLMDADGGNINEEPVTDITIDENSILEAIN